MKFKDGTTNFETSSNEDEKEKAYKCIRCHRGYKSLSGLTGHLKSVHNEDYNA